MVVLVNGTIGEVKGAKSVDTIGGLDANAVKAMHKRLLPLSPPARFVQAERVHH